MAFCTLNGREERGALTTDEEVRRVEMKRASCEQKGWMGQR
jgi:hypothetical protein